MGDAVALGSDALLGLLHMQQVGGAGGWGRTGSGRGGGGGGGERERTGHKASVIPFAVM